MQDLFYQRTEGVKSLKYTVKEAAKKLNMTSHTIRYYTDKGLIPSIKRDNNNYRVFDENSLRWLKAAQFLRKSGMSIDEISKYFEICQKGGDNFHEKHEILLTLYERTQKEYEEILTRKKDIEQRKDYFEKVIEGVEKDVCNPLYWDIIPDTEDDIFK